MINAVKELDLRIQYHNYISDKSNPPDSYTYWLTHVYPTYGEKWIAALNQTIAGNL